MCVCLSLLDSQGIWELTASDSDRHAATPTNTYRRRIMHREVSELKSKDLREILLLVCANILNFLFLSLCHSLFICLSLALTLSIFLSPSLFLSLSYSLWNKYKSISLTTYLSISMIISPSFSLIYNRHSNFPFLTFLKSILTAFFPFKYPIHDLLTLNIPIIYI